MRVLITGAATRLGARVATLLAGDRRVKALAGVDAEFPEPGPPGMELTAVDLRDRRRLLAAVRDFGPTVIVHLGVFEPRVGHHARVALERTSSGSLTVLGAAGDLGTVERLVVRSGIEVYGRARRAPSVPDESLTPNPTTPFGRALLEVERLAAAAGETAGIPVATLRLAPLVGAGVDSPLERYLRLPVVPVSALADPTFSVLHVDDAAAALVAALGGHADLTLNVVAPGALSVWQAARLGRHVPLPFIGPEWRVVRPLLDQTSVPFADHLLELIHRGRTADGSRAPSVLGVSVTHTTRQAVEALWRPPAPPPTTREEQAA
jgi:UDP-glucose 4-epimerase